MFAVCTRFFRRKAVVGFLLLLSVLLLAANLAWHYESLVRSEQGSMLRLRKLNQPFNWHLEEEDEINNNDNNKTREVIATCRNSVQGKTHIADDRGYVCSRFEVESNGCCSVNGSTTIRFLCSDCDTVASCCGQYEACLSCCLRPQQKTELQQILNTAADNNDVLFVSVSDHFELCLAKCRTSSSSVHHENSYRNPKKKFCYGKNPPPTVGDQSDRNF